MKKNILISACLLGCPTRYDGRSMPCESAMKLAEKYNLIPICPEIYGGLPTPRTPSEGVGDKVLMKDGTNVTENYKRGAEAALHIAKMMNIDLAVLKEKSPSCGVGKIYDGTFSGTLTSGYGVAAEILFNNGIRVVGESDIDKIEEV